MSYTPTLEDIGYLVRYHPENFSNPLQTSRSVQNALGQRNVAEELTVGPHYQDYLDNGGTPLTESIVPPEPDEDGDGILDPEFAALCVECQSGTPCCMTAGSIEDATDSSRKLEWPLPSPPALIPTTLLVIARELEGTDLTSKFKVKWEGTPCQVGWPDRPRFDANNLTDRRSQITEEDFEATVGYPALFSAATILQQYIPEKVVYALMIFDVMMALERIGQAEGGATLTPFQCLSNPSMQGTYRVIPIPYVQLSGEITLATRISITTGGSSANAQAEASITGTLGNITLEGKRDATSGSNTGRVPDSGAEAKGLIGTMASIIQKMDHYVGQGNTRERTPPSPRILDRTAFASGVTLSKSLTFKPSGFELVPRSDTPDLELAIGALEATLALGISGKIDFIDALAMAFTGPGATAIREARARMANNETVSATLQADLELAARGALTHNINSEARVGVLANGEFDAAWDGISQEFGGEFKISANAELKIEVEANVWVFSAKAGASGSLHTAWIWRMRKQDRKRQKQYEFEGVVLRLSAYIEGRVTEGENVTQDIFSLGGEASSETQVGDLFEQVRGDLAASRDAAATMAQAAANAPAAEGEQYTIWQPEVSEWEDY